MKRLLIALIIIPALIEVGLYAVNPAGFVQYQDDFRAFLDTAITTDQTTDYALLPGRHFFADWIMTVNTDGTRWVPASNIEAEKEIAFIGDSVTMGWGVDDYDTWVNLVARTLPDWRIVNAGVARFNSRNVRLTLRAVNADVYIYYITDNDHEKNAPGIDYTPRWQPLTLRYLRYIFRARKAATEPDYKRFDADITEIAGANVFFVGHGELFNRVAARYPSRAFWLERWTSNISAVDGHADKAGNQEIAEQMIEVVREILKHE